jgi:hypothetical protein
MKNFIFVSLTLFISIHGLTQDMENEKKAPFKPGFNLKIAATSMIIGSYDLYAEFPIAKNTCLETRIGFLQPWSFITNRSQTSALLFLKGPSYAIQVRHYCKWIKGIYTGVEAFYKKRWFFHQKTFSGSRQSSFYQEEDHTVNLDQSGGRFVLGLQLRRGHKVIDYYAALGISHTSGYNIHYAHYEPSYPGGGHPSYASYVPDQITYFGRFLPTLSAGIKIGLYL